MKFQKFSSLENHYRERFLNEIRTTIDPNEEWVATEKVHGANFSIWYNGTYFKFARRTGFIEEKFYNWRSAMTEEFLDKIRGLYQKMVHAYEEMDEGDTLAIYGELYGAGVQRGVKYSNDDKNQKFVAFDLQINGSPLGFQLASAYMHAHEIEQVPVIATGTLEELVKLNPEFDSVLGKMNGVEELINLAEGLVIKPYIHVHYTNQGERMVIKHKHPNFSEKTGRKPRKPVPELTDEQGFILSDLMTYINENRLRNVLSKFGAVTQKDFGKVQGFLAKDALDDYILDEEPISDENWEALKKPYNKEVGNLVRKNFLNIIDGVF